LLPLAFLFPEYIIISHYLIIVAF